MTAYRFIQAEEATWPVRAMCSALRVSRSAYYVWRAAKRGKRAQADAVLVVHIKAAHRRSRGTYGAPRVTAELLAEGHEVGRGRVARLMAAHGLSGTPKRRFRPQTTDSDHDDRVADNVLGRQFTTTGPNQARVGDITYLPTLAGWVYLAVLIDLFSRKVVGWSLRSDMETELCLSALRQAATTRQPRQGLVHHSDRGSQYTSKAYQRALRGLRATPSMSRKGNCWDNAVAESFFGTLEQELVGQLGAPWADEHAVRVAVGDYVHGFYNLRRRHSVLGQVSPIDFEANRSHRQMAA